MRGRYIAKFIGGKFIRNVLTRILLAFSTGILIVTSLITFNMKVYSRCLEMIDLLRKSALTAMKDNITFTDTRYVFVSGTE
jgi:hypothetical protein